MRIIFKSFFTMLFSGSLVMALTVPLTASDPSNGTKAKAEHVEDDKYAKMAELEALAKAAAEKKLAAKGGHAETTKPAAMDEHTAKDDHVEMAKPAAIDEPAAKEDPAGMVKPAAMDEHAAENERAEVAKPAAMNEHTAKDDHAETVKPAVMDEHATKGDYSGMAKPVAMDDQAAKEDHAEMAKPATMDDQAAKDDHTKMVTKPAAMDEPAAKNDHAEMAEPTAMDEHATENERAEVAEPAAMNESAAKDEHVEMEKPAAMDEHATEDDAQMATKPAAMDEQVAKEDHAEMAKPAAKDEPASKDGHVKIDPQTAKGEHVADNGHGTKDKRTAEEQFMALEALFGKKGKAAKAKTAETDEQGDAGEHAEKSDTADAGEYDEEAQPEQFETSLEALPEGPNQPWRLIRHLQLLQDKIVQGKPNALAHYRDALVDMSHKLLEDDRVGTWAHERNLMAAATYLLIGGDPNVGRHAFDMSNLSLIQKLPLAAAIAYVDRNYSRAGRLLMAIDIDRLPSSAKGQFALVQAMATSSKKTGKAIGHLEQARRFAPGTLTEEAALRRLIRIAAESADKPEGVDVFFNHANAYFRHYSKSFYATDFLRNYGFGLVQTPDDVGERALAHLKSVVPSLKKEQQIFMIAIVARNAVVLGKLDLGRWASDWLLENVGPGDKLHARIELYHVATSLLDADSYADSAKRLKKLPVEYLGKSDMSLYKALTQLSSRIGSEIIDVEKLKEITRIEKQSFPGDEPELPFDVEKEMVLAKTNPVLMRTEELLEKADRLLER